MQIIHAMMRANWAVTGLARFIHFWWSQGTPNIWYLSILKRYKFETLEG